MQKIVVFDFDKTLTYNDTLLGFYLHCNPNIITKSIKFLVYLPFMILFKTSLIKNDTLKKIGIRIFLYKLTKTNLIKYSKSYAKTIIFNSVFKYFSERVNTKSNKVYIISASFESYLSELFKKYDVKVVGSSFIFDSNNKINGLHNNLYGFAKKKYLNRVEHLKEIHEFFTDSYSDIYLAKIAKKIIVVKKDKLIKCNSLQDFKLLFRK